MILPTYHAGDRVAYASLRHWAERLHRLQNEGKINRDVMIFINFDADAEFWTGADLPLHLQWLPNTGGIGQLVESVADLAFVTFSNVSDYLNTHRPVGAVQFSQDTIGDRRIVFTLPLETHGGNRWLPAPAYLKMNPSASISGKTDTSPPSPRMASCSWMHRVCFSISFTTGSS